MNTSGDRKLKSERKREKKTVNECEGRKGFVIAACECHTIILIIINTHTHTHGNTPISYMLPPLGISITYVPHEH